MELVRKISFVFIIVFSLVGCTSTGTLTLAEIKPLPKEVVVEVKQEFEPVYSVMKILEVSEVNGVQKFVIAKLDKVEGKEIAIEMVGEISDDISFEKVLGTFKVTSKAGGFLKGSIETLTHKIPTNSYIRVQIGQKAKEEK